MRLWITAAAGAVLSTLFAGGALAAGCPQFGSFETWLAGVRAEARAAGISERTLAAALDGVVYDQSVVDRDRAQGVFSQTFLEFSSRMVEGYRLPQGQQRLKAHAALFSRIEKDFGVPGPVIAAFWGLETDFGANMGKFRTIPALASLAFDCRRPEKFRPHLIDALKLIERGDLKAEEMIGAWAGEIGQMQFLPSDYLRSAVDYDGDGKRNLIRSVPDVLASSASLLRDHGWQAGQPWLEEVRVPASMPWQEADLAVRHSRAEWAKWGVTRPDGAPLKADATQASLLLPMGRNGPAFLAYQNFQVYLQWNQSLVYALSAAYMATRLSGAPQARKGNGPVTPLSLSQMRDLQRLLAARGFAIGKIDGVLGAQTRAAIKATQLKLGLPADSYPTAELLARLKGG